MALGVAVGLRGAQVVAPREPVGVKVASLVADSRHSMEQDG